MEKKISIICQASADILHALALYEKYKTEASISIYCVNIQPIYDFLKSLNLDLSDLVFIPNDTNFSAKKPLSILKARRKIRTKYNTLFLQKRDETIYFFAIWFDWVSFAFISQLAKQNELIYYQHYLSVTETGKEKYSLKEQYLLTQYYLLTGIRLQYTKELNTKRLLFPYYKHGIKKQAASIIQDSMLIPYLFQPQNITERSILLLESELGSYKIFENYHSNMIEIVDTLKDKGFNIHIKGHPNLGTTKEIEGICNFVIPKEIPSELIDVSQFKCILGIQSFSLVYYAKKQNTVFSLIELLSFKKSDAKEKYIDYLQVNSNHTIKFPQKISDLCL